MSEQYAERYPTTPGHRGNNDTSIAAADAIAPALPKLQRTVFAVIEAAGSSGITADGIAIVLGWERWRVRPRTSELRAAGKIVDSGMRRPSLSGISSIVWVTAEHAPAAQPVAA